MTQDELLLKRPLSKISKLKCHRSPTWVRDLHFLFWKSYLTFVLTQIPRLMMDGIDLIAWLQTAPETPILNNWDLIKFLLPRISPIPTEGKQNQCCWILNCALRKKLVFNDPIFQYICISQTSCNGSRSFSLSTFTKHKKSKILPIPFSWMHESSDLI